MLANIIEQGVTCSWLATITDYPYPASEGWGLRLVMNPRAGGSVVTVNSTPSGDDHLIQISASATAVYAAGSYGYGIYAIKGGEQYQLEAGQLEVRVGLLVAAGGADTRSLAQRALDDANAALAAWSPATKRYRINGREMEFNSPAEIIAVVNHWTNAVKAENAAKALAAGRPNPRKLQVRLGRA